ncbi:multicopper oxidase family protein [Niveispirillum fermenti]|uniref:multicopper oxidase family protein n=1 Tax=Niveispirillum fermenti TaxID=1233113 RepID=UPI003A8BF2C6
MGDLGMEPWRGRSIAMAALLLLAGCGTATAQRAELVRELEPPAVLSAVPQQARDAADPRGYNLLSQGALATAIRAGRELHYDLPIQYTTGRIYNPATDSYDTVSLRSYGDAFMAPTIVMDPGQTVRINLDNRLDPEPLCGRQPDGQPMPINQPHCFNDTNLHSHGLWVSPTGNSDNVLLTIKPRVKFQYEYNVPEDHPAGTFWYHPHKHGSTAMQVGSGMAGALVVRGSRPPTLVGNGDLDTLLSPFAPAGGVAGEVMLIQQIPYACFNNKGEIKTDARGRWICDKGDIGKVENFAAQFDFRAWKASGRYTMFNGVVRGTDTLQAGQLYRWRLIHAGVEETINLRIRKVSNPARRLTRITSARDQEAEVKGLCAGADVTQYEVAVDGLTRPSIYAKTVNNLQPGYRSDILFVLPEAGDYCVYDDADQSGDQIVDNDNAKIIGFIRATGPAKVADSAAFVQEQLTRSADRLPPDVAAIVKADLNGADGMRLTKYLPHQAITEAEIERWQKTGVDPIDIVFNLTDESPSRYLINGKAYDPAVMNQTLLLGAAQEWRLSSDRVSHPFHIHVNPFEIISIKSKTTGQELTGGIYAGMKGTWRDTIMTGTDAIITIRTRYNRYIGSFVLHCHILDHEDQGMMQNVQIVLPGTDGKPVMPGHH